MNYLLGLSKSCKLLADVVDTIKPLQPRIRKQGTHSRIRPVCTPGGLRLSCTGLPLPCRRLSKPPSHPYQTVCSWGTSRCYCSFLWEILIASQEHVCPTFSQLSQLEEGMAAHSSILAWRIPMGREAWQTIVHGVAKSQTRLNE